MRHTLAALAVLPVTVACLGSDPCTKRFGKARQLRGFTWRRQMSRPPTRAVAVMMTELRQRKGSKHAPRWSTLTNMQKRDSLRFILRAQASSLARRGRRCLLLVLLPGGGRKRIVYPGTYCSFQALESALPYLPDSLARNAVLSRQVIQRLWLICDIRASRIARSRADSTLNVSDRAALRRS